MLLANPKFLVPRYFEWNKLMAKARIPNLAQPEPNGTKLRHRPEHQFLRNTWPSRAAVPMFLLLQVLVNCGLAAVSNAFRKFENVAAGNKKLKPFCMQFRKDEAKPEILTWHSQNQMAEE